MKLSEAMRIASQPVRGDAVRFNVFLVSGYNPLHLATFLKAELRIAMPDRAVELCTGVFGDPHGNLKKAAHSECSAIALSIEWQDLDPRLGLRRLGGWSPGSYGDILTTAAESLKRLSPEICSAANQAPVVISLPTLPLPPVAYTPRFQTGGIALDLQALVADFAAALPNTGSVRILNADLLNAHSPAGQRLDIKLDLAAGFPYTLSHAGEMARMFSRLIHPAAPKKGLVTDLDDTLWSGILGEIGPENIAWDLEHHAQIHGLYQQLLAALADAGVLIGVISKNDPAVVEQAFRRTDLVLSRDLVFPLEAGWGSKSKAMARILERWNIGASDVVFVDDSPIELAEVQSEHPGVECLLFEKRDAASVYALLEKLRDCFGRTSLSEEDRIRRESLRRAPGLTLEQSGNGEVSDLFLEQLNAEIGLNFAKEPPDQRAFELVNKTNQFNLNGRRYEEAEWKRRLASPDTFLAVASYKDKFGPLGKIAVLTGRREGGLLLVDTWVMSCRAFARRIEFRCLASLFDTFECEEIAFEFAATPRNGPLRDFLAAICGAEPVSGIRLSRETFDARCPKLYDRNTGGSAFVRASDQSL